MGLAVVVFSLAGRKAVHDSGKDDPPNFRILETGLGSNTVSSTKFQIASTLSLYLKYKIQQKCIS